MHPFVRLLLYCFREEIPRLGKVVRDSGAKVD